MEIIPPAASIATPTTTPTTTTRHNPASHDRDHDRAEDLGVPPRTKTWRATENLSTAALAVLAMVAVFGDLALQTGLSGVVSVLGILAAIGFVWQAGLLTSNRSRAMVAGAAALAMWIPLRDSLWLVVLNTLTAGSLIFTAAVFDQQPWPRLSPRSAMQLFQRLAAGLAAPLLLIRSVAASTSSKGNTGSTVAAVLRGLALAALPVVVLGGLLLQADVVLASAVQIDGDVGSLVLHGFLIAMVALAATGMICVGWAETSDDPGRPSYIGGVEGVTVLGCIFVLFSAFAGAQAVGIFANVDELLATQGTTHAEYARSGFFQLLAVATLTLMALQVLRAIGEPATGPVEAVRRVLGTGVCLLTVLIVAVSIVRLSHYVDAFGQTTLRWYSTTFALLLGAIFVLFAVDHALDFRRAWFGLTSFTLVVASLFAVNAANPERRVAEYNLTHTATESHLDAYYLTSLSADAWPTLLQHPEMLIGNTRSLVDWDRFVWRCEKEGEQMGWGVFGFNVARSRLACPMGASG